MDKLKEHKCRGCDKMLTNTISTRGREYEVIWCSQLCRSRYSANYQERHTGIFCDVCGTKELRHNALYKTCYDCRKKPGTCSECSKIGKLIGGKCRGCYNKKYHETYDREEHRILKKQVDGDWSCTKCSAPMSRPTRTGQCKNCRRYVDRVPKDLTPRMLRGFYVSPTDINTIRILLVKYKHGFINALDYYRIVSLYTELNGLVGGYDDFPIDKQIKLMMKNFKLLMDKNI